MKIKKIKDALTGKCDTERMEEMHLLIVAIDPTIPTGVKSVTLDFQNREEGLQAFNVLAATARNVHKTYIEDTRLYTKSKTANASLHA